MAGPVVQSAMIPASVINVSRVQLQGSRKGGGMKMMSGIRTGPLKMPCFLGSKGSGSFVFLKPERAILVPCSKPSCGPSVAVLLRGAEKVMEVIKLAHEEARCSGHNSVGTEQILLGLIGEGTGIATEILKSTGVSLKDARVEVERIIGRHAPDDRHRLSASVPPLHAMRASGGVAVDIPFTQRAKHVLELAREEAQKLGHGDIRPEHLLLGLLRDGEGVAALVLDRLGADPSNIRTQVIRMIGESTEAVGAGVEVKAVVGKPKTHAIEKVKVDYMAGKVRTRKTRMEKKTVVAK